MHADSGSSVATVETTLPAEARAPRSLDETGLPFLFLVELVAKVLFQRGQVRLPELATHLKLSISVITPLVTHLRNEKLCEVTRSGHSGTDADLTYHLTDAGAQRAIACLSRNSYAGPAPVTLAAYVAQVDAQSVRNLHVTRDHVRAAYHDVVASPGVLDQMGAAMNSGRAVFIYGQAGSGKTFLAERLCGLLHGAIAVPYAIMIDGEVVPFYDPVQHRPAAGADPTDTGDSLRALDARWVRGLQRPTALTGGELTLEMLDLRFDANTRLYQAPPHLKANNGIFIIDDLGRQRCSPLELMNRWIVPMDRGVDYLSLHTGLVFQVPFDVVVVFSSNFLPERLSDGAFLRRLGYKIEVPPQTQAEYELLFRQACAQYGMAFDAAAFAYLLSEHHAKEDTPMLACYPRDLVRQVRDLARYESAPAQLDRRSIDWAWNNYFAGAGARRVADQQKKERERRDHTTPG
ncbi:ATP-binding protein [Duganella aceris]|uniref:ATP-binding protein n=1 Tax=Duganella aceris TaxID=2703883 RepID=A0ABX0FPE3_9BURK|nr:ATP-binding protein [Duganella aceris]NGZ86499.1 ATP-binding protein [Duganella aceris]